MDIRLLFGKYKGEIRDVESQTAREMIADGRAKNPFKTKHAPHVPNAQEVKPVE